MLTENPSCRIFFNNCRSACPVGQRLRSHRLRFAVLRKFSRQAFSSNASNSLPGAVQYNGRGAPSGETWRTACVPSIPSMCVTVLVVSMHHITVKFCIFRRTRYSRAARCLQSRQSEVRIKVFRKCASTSRRSALAPGAKTRLRARACHASAH